MSGETKAIYTKNKYCFDGDFVIYYKSGNKKRAGTFENNKLVGLTSYYLDNENNTLHRTSLRSNDSLVFNVIFYPNGTIMKEGYQINQKKISEWKVYNQIGEVIQVEQNP